MRRAFGGCILTFAVACPFGSPPVQAQGPGLGGYGGMTYSAPAGIGAGRPDHSLWRQSERLHAIPHGRRGHRRLIRLSEPRGDGVPDLVPYVVDHWRNAHVGGGLRAKRGQCRTGLSRAALVIRQDGARRRHEQIDERGQRQRDAAELWLPVLSAAQPARFFVVFHGNVVDVTDLLADGASSPANALPSSPSTCAVWR